MKKALFLPLFFLLISASCSFLLSDDPADFKDKQLSIKRSPSSNWIPIEKGRSDYAYLNNESKSIVVINSLCKKYNYSDHKQLMDNMFSGVEKEIIETKEDKIHQVLASILTVSIKVDGERRFVKTILFRKNYCIYDAYLISTSLEFLEHDSPALFNYVENMAI
ncbi:MAG: hypothetical protein H6622_00885 [Halobacteriovoraceae bacterium]|nr:hypothetical protein [Halobacteriovoraceae bacterium]